MSAETYKFIESQSSLDTWFRSIATVQPVVAIDAERASSFRYTSRAYLLQLKVENSPTAVIDPLAVTSFKTVSDWVNQSVVVLHSATQDLECLRELGIHPQYLFDTELAAKLLGKEKVGLKALLENELGIYIDKEFSAVDWSKRPLPDDWITYAALDVEHLLELHQLLKDQLILAQRERWAEEEFAFLTKWQPKIVNERWRRTSGLHKVKQRHQLARVQALWQARDKIAKEHDLAPSKVLRDEALVEIALSRVQTSDEIAVMLKQKFRVKIDHSKLWWRALTEADALPEEEHPVFHQKNPNGLPPIKAWNDKNPNAAERFGRIRQVVLQTAEDLGIAPEVLINPETIRQVAWHFDHWDESTLIGKFQGLQTRQWQLEQLLPSITTMLR